MRLASSIAASRISQNRRVSPGHWCMNQSMAIPSYPCFPQEDTTQGTGRSRRGTTTSRRFARRDIWNDPEPAKPCPSGASAGFEPPHPDIPTAPLGRQWLSRASDDARSLPRTTPSHRLAGNPASTRATLSSCWRGRTEWLHPRIYAPTPVAGSDDRGSVWKSRLGRPLGSIQGGYAGYGRLRSAPYARPTQRSRVWHDAPSGCR